MALSVYTPAGIVHETSVDFTKRVLTEPVHLVQYDESLPVVAVTCLDAGQYMTLTASDTVSIRMDKKDGTFIYNPALGMSADGHTVYVQITLQMTTNYGRFEPVLELLRGNGYGCSSPIPLFIDVNPVPEDEIESASEYGTIIEIRDEVKKMKDETQEIIDSSVMTFDEAATRENIVSGESLSTIMGKVKKWFADLKNAAFHTVANNYTTTEAGYVLDARLGPDIKSKMDLADTLRLHDVLAIDTTETEIPSGANINSYTTPGVYYVASDNIAANISNIPRKSSGKLVVGSRHGSVYLYQEYYPSSDQYYRYIRSYTYGSWSMWISELYDYLEIGQRSFHFTDGISSASNKTIGTLFNIPYTYGAYFLILRADTGLDAAWVGIVRHNVEGYQVSTVYKGSSDRSPYVATNGVLKTDSTSSIPVHAIFLPIYVWN